MPPIDKPNYTQVPNTILGDIERGNIIAPGLMATLEGSQLKVLLAVCRLTFGYHQNTRRASITMIENLTGLSRQGVINAANKLEELGLIKRAKDGGVTLWQVVVKSFDYLESSELVNSVDSLVNSFDQSSQLSRLPSKKETIKKPGKKSERPPTIPAVQVFVEVTEKYCLNKTQIKVLSNKIGDTPAALDKWREVVTAWQLCGYKLININGMLDWFTNGIPTYKNGANQNGHKPNYSNGRTGHELESEPTVNIYDEPTT